MAFAVNSNIGSQKVYNALAASSSKTQSAQLRLATGKKVNSAADDTSGWNVGKQLEASSLKMKSELSNIGSGKNFLSTAESALQQVYDKLNEIQVKQEDAKDPLKSASSLQNDVKTLADEIDSILKNTKINGTDLLASAASSFGAGASSVSINIGSAIGDNATGLTALKKGDATSLTTDIATFQTNIRTAITYIGNQSQVLESRSDFLTSAISNNDAAVSQLFDTDTLNEQMTTSTGQIQGQLSTSMMSQMNTTTQNLLSLFR